MKDHEVRQLVNDLVSISLQYGNTQQLRERIKATVIPVIDTLRVQAADYADMRVRCQELIEDFSFIVNRKK